MSFTDRVRDPAVRILRWSEKYTKTDMVYLIGAGIWTNLNFVITSVLALLLSIAFANLLPRDVYGTYQYFLSIGALLTAVTLAGMANAIPQSAARGFDGDLRASVRVQLLWSIVPVLIGLGIALYYVVHGNVALAIGLAVVALLAPTSNAFYTYNAFLQGKRDFKRMFTYGSAVNAAYYMSIFVTILLFKNAVILVFVNLASNGIAMALLYWRTLKTRVQNDNKDPETIRFGVHLSVQNAFWTGVTQLDNVLVYHFLGPVALAVYAFATLIPERAGGFFNFIGMAALPKYANQSLEHIRETLLARTLRVAAIAACGAIVYVIAAPLLFKLIFPSYLDAIWYTQLYAPVILLTPIINFTSSIFAAQRLKKELYVINFVYPVMLIALQIPLLLSYGILGMVVARIVTDIVGVAIILVLIFKARPAKS